MPAVFQGQTNGTNGGGTVASEVVANAGLNLNTSTLALETGHIASVDVKLPVLVNGRIPTDGSAVTQPVSLDNLPLPSGAATAANQAIEVTALQTLATRGQQVSATSTSVVLSSDGPFATNFGLQADTVATTDTGSFSLLALIKRGLQNWTALLAKIPTLNADGGMPSHVTNTVTTANQGMDGAATPRALLTDSAGRQSVREDSVQGSVALTVGTIYAAARQLFINCTVAGNVSVTFTDASTLVIPVVVGITTLSWAVTAVNTSGTTATATYANLK